MEINNEILEIFQEFKIQKDNGICYLLSLYYGYKPDYIPDNFKQKMNTTGIYTEEKGSIKWNIPLFEGQQTAFDWVKTEYVTLFKEANDAKGGHVREATTLIKQVFAKNPSIRKDDILGATRLYIQNTDPRFIMLPHYFIQKGKGGEKTQTLLTWLDKYEESKSKDQESEREHVTNSMQ